MSLAEKILASVPTYYRVQRARVKSDGSFEFTVTVYGSDHDAILTGTQETDPDNIELVADLGLGAGATMLDALVAYYQDRKAAFETITGLTEWNPEEA